MTQRRKSFCHVFTIFMQIVGVRGKSGTSTIRGRHARPAEWSRSNWRTAGGVLYVIVGTMSVIVVAIFGFTMGGYASTNTDHPVMHEKLPVAGMFATCSSSMRVNACFVSYPQCIASVPARSWVLVGLLGPRPCAKGRRAPHFCLSLVSLCGSDSVMADKESAEPRDGSVQD